MSTTPRRKTITMDSAKIGFIERATNESSPEFEALQHLSGRGIARSSESAVINKLIDLGIAKVQEEATMTGYAALAAEQESETDRAFKTKVRRNTARAFQRS